MLCAISTIDLPLSNIRVYDNNHGQLLQDVQKLVADIYWGSIHVYNFSSLRRPQVLAMSCCFQNDPFFIISFIAPPELLAGSVLVSTYRCTCRWDSCWRLHCVDRPAWSAQGSWRIGLLPVTLSLQSKAWWILHGNSASANSLKIGLHIH